jgi:hypothetical protein
MLGQEQNFDAKADSKISDQVKEQDMRKNLWGRAVSLRTGRSRLSKSADLAANTVSYGRDSTASSAVMNKTDLVYVNTNSYSYSENGKFSPIFLNSPVQLVDVVLPEKAQEQGDTDKAEKVSNLI